MILDRKKSWLQAPLGTGAGLPRCKPLNVSGLQKLGFRGNCTASRVEKKHRFPILFPMILAPSGPNIFISAAEPSADLHAASLIEAVRKLEPRARFTGVAGPRMRRAGCNSIYDMTKHSSMLTAVLGQAHHAYRMLSLARHALEQTAFDLAVVVDAPTLHLPVAKHAGAAGIPVLYYIAPQTWAWGGNLRIPRVRARVDRIACIWPFEEPYFRSHGIDADYVGHPLFARLTARQVDRNAVEALRSHGGPVLTIMPGSRRHVVEENFSNQLAVAQAVRGRFPALKILVSVANARVKHCLRGIMADLDSTGVELHQRENAELLAAADLALVASGTVTLEAAYHRTPMIVMYNSSRRLYPFVQWLISTPYFSLPNILAQRELVPEFMPYYVSIDPIVDRALGLMSDPDARRHMAAELGRTIDPFVHTQASDTTARIVLDMVESRRLAPPAEKHRKWLSFLRNKPNVPAPAAGQLEEEIKQ